MGGMPEAPRQGDSEEAGAGWPSLILVALAAVVGLGLLCGPIASSSATYDEVAYLRIGARWWRTGQEAEIARMGSPLLFLRLQQAPVYWILDRWGKGHLIDDPILHQAALLPIVRVGAAWIWIVAFGMTSWASRRLYGPRAMALAAWLFTLSPNLIAHGSLATMELPLVASGLAMILTFRQFLVTDRRGWFLASAVAGGLAFSCKFTTILFPPILGLAWAFHLWGARASRTAYFREMVRRTIPGMVLYVLVLGAANFVVTGFATLPLSSTKGPHPSLTRLGPILGPLAARIYEAPIPQDWVGLANQFHHQVSGGPSYLFGERRMRGWRYYYLVALAVKVPLTFWPLMAGRAWIWRRRPARDGGSDLIFPLFLLTFLALTSLGSSRNYGLRYLLPLAPLAIIWTSALAEETSGRRPVVRKGLIAIGLLGQLAAVASIHPHELTYFNALAGGPIGGRRILSDSNLDWGQGLRSLVRLQSENPDLRDLTLYYFGDTSPRRYGVESSEHVVTALDDGTRLPDISTVRTRYLAVSASLQHGPWGPPGFFRRLDQIRPFAYTDDTTIALYRTADLEATTPRGSNRFPDTMVIVAEISPEFIERGEALDEDRKAVFLKLLGVEHGHRLVDHAARAIHAVAELKPFAWPGRPDPGQGSPPPPGQDIAEVPLGGPRGGAAVEGRGEDENHWLGSGVGCEDVRGGRLRSGCRAVLQPPSSRSDRAYRSAVCLESEANRVGRNGRLAGREGPRGVGSLLESDAASPPVVSPEGRPQRRCSGPPG